MFLHRKYIVPRLRHNQNFLSSFFGKCNYNLCVFDFLSGLLTLSEILSEVGSKNRFDFRKSVPLLWKYVELTLAGWFKTTVLDRS